MEMRLRAPVTRGYFFLLGALRLVNAASPRNIDQKKISSGTQGTKSWNSVPDHHRTISDLNLFRQLISTTIFENMSAILNLVLHFLAYLVV